MRTVICSSALILLVMQHLVAQVGEQLPLNKPSAAETKSINTISFHVSSGELRALHEAKGKKLTLKASKVAVNEDTLKVKHIRVRGNTSSYFRRKSLNIKTDKKARFHTVTDTFSVNKFYAISMNMDHNYVRNKIAYGVLKLTDVRVPSNSYASLSINNATEGLYLIFYPPDEYAMKKCNAPFVIRRGYGEAMDKVYVQKNVNRQQESEYKKKFRSLYAPSTMNKSGEELYKEISAVLDLNTYFSWLAFNHLFQNADYADEAYFMWNPKKSKFEIIPWDFDDILKGHPHEGAEARSKVQSDKLIFSLEDELDKKIASDSFLYEKYLRTYESFLKALTKERLRNVLTRVFDDVYPYYMQQDIIAQSQYDQYGRTDLGLLEGDLNSIYQYISVKAKELNENVASQLAKE
ncbi:MAG: CotH kinase family protein [Chryseolinea sp.]